MPAVQRSLIEAVSALGKPTVGVAFSGRALALGEVAEHLDAIVLGLLRRPLRRAAVAEVLAGAVKPQG
ncbi:glycoside hydrolase family 3 C-terminal domain-containing protein [Streptomyces asiaticus]|uniref:glycoside hydrolase family 3 C-terminal domain-containing protein n=1 Tax=Streptomyces asiaticus TaxID=114695 RepID=UPI003D7145E9